MGTMSRLVCRVHTGENVMYQLTAVNTVRFWKITTFDVSLFFFLGLDPLIFIDVHVQL
jgi:hypothetical protein